MEFVHDTLNEGRPASSSPNVRENRMPKKPFALVKSCLATGSTSQERYSPPSIYEREDVKSNFTPFLLIDLLVLTEYQRWF